MLTVLLSYFVGSALGSSAFGAASGALTASVAGAAGLASSGAFAAGAVTAGFLQDAQLTPTKRQGRQMMMMDRNRFMAFLVD